MGGSSWSAAARCGTKIATATVKAIRLTNLRACFLIPHSLLKLERSRVGLAPRASFLGRLGLVRNADALSMHCTAIGPYRALLVCRIRKGPICFYLLNTCETEEL